MTPQADKSTAFHEVFDDAPDAPATHRLSAAGSSGMDVIEARPFLKTPRVWIAAGAVIAAIALAGSVSSWVAAPTATTVSAETIRVATVSHVRFDDVIEVRGQLESDNLFTVTSDLSGRVSAVLVETGQSVTAGQPLLTLENRDVALELGQARTRLANADSAIQDLTVKLETGRFNNRQKILSLEGEITALANALDGRRALAAEGFAPANSVRDMEINLNHQKELLALEREAFSRVDAALGEQLATARIVRQQAAAALGLAQATAVDLTLTAPTDGQISGFGILPGETLNAGQTVAQIRDTGQPIARASVDEYYLSALAVGQTADITLAGQTVQGELARIETDITNGTFRSDWRLVDLSPAQRDTMEFGQSLRIRHAIGGQRETLAVETGPFFGTRSGEFVYRLSPDGRAVRQGVIFGRNNGTQIEIIDGLQAGDRIITSSYADFDRFDEVRIK